MKYEINRNWWLKWYWDYIEPIYEVEAHYGTRQSGKTWNIGKKLIYHSFQPKKFNVIHSRKVYADIEGSTFKILCDIIYKYFPNDFTITKDHFFIKNKHTGNWFRGLGMDKAEKGKGIEGANIAWLNECNQFNLDDFDYIDTTIRGDISSQIGIFADWNPEKQNHWLYAESSKWAVRPNCKIIKSTFWDNYLIDRNALHEKLLRIKERGKDGERRYKVWALGDWGIEDPSKLFARDFDSTIHVGETTYDPNELTYLAFDLNYDPTCLVIQTHNGIQVLREYHEQGQNLPTLLAKVKRDYPNPFYIVNGDASGNHSRNLTDNSTSYEIIKEILQLSYNEIRVPKANPTHRKSRHVTNLLLIAGQIRIDSSCTELITDLESVEVDDNESIDPYKKAHSKRSHWLDSFRYHLHAEHSKGVEEMKLENY